MTKTIADIEFYILNFLKNNTCSKILHILNGQTENPVKTLLTSEHYSMEKLNLCIWLLTTCDSHLAVDLMDCDFLANELKLTKIYEAFHTLGLVDSNESNFHKLILQTNNRNYKDLLLLLNEIIELIDASANDQMDSFHDTIDDNDNKQRCFTVDILYNDEFIIDYKNTIETHSTLISSDLTPLLKDIHSKTKATNPLKLVNEKINNLKDEIIKTSKDLNILKEIHNLNNDSLVKVDCDDTFNSLKISIYGANKYLNEFKDLINSIKEPNLNDNLDNFDILGEKFKEIMELMENFDKYCKFYSSLSKYMENQELNHVNLSKFLSSKPEITQILHQIEAENDNEEQDSIISRLKNSLSLLIN